MSQGEKKYSYYRTPPWPRKLLDLGMVIKASAQDILGKQPVLSIKNMKNRGNKAGIMDVDGEEAKHHSGNAKPFAFKYET